VLECIVTKFGGSSLANDEQFRKVRSILELEPTRQYLVPSAPGKRFPTDEKVTDLLYLCYELVSKGKSFEEQFVKIRERYLSIAQHLHLKVDIESALDEVAQGIAGGKSRDWCASRGEYLCGLLIADYLGWRFVDAAKGIRFRQDGTLDDDKTQELLSAPGRMERSSHSAGEAATLPAPWWPGRWGLTSMRTGQMFRVS